MFTMETLPRNKLLEYLPDSIDYVRKIHNLHQPGRMKEAVQILDDWVKKQNHFTKKDINPIYLEKTIIECKGSLERAKKQIDKICTYRTLMPAFFKQFDVRKDFGDLHDIIAPIVLPKMTSDHNRIFLVKLYDHPFKASQFMDYYKLCVSIGEYMQLHDYANGFIVFGDFREIDLMDLITKLNPIEFGQAMKIYMEALGMRVKGIHILSSSKLINTFVTILKQVLSEKISKRIHTHKTVDTVYKYIPKEILPIEYDGQEKSIKEIHEKWLEVLGSKEHLDDLDELRETKTDESCRESHEFNAEYAGLPGTFRELSLD